jgi:hypothetical protein
MGNVIQQGNRSLVNLAQTGQKMTNAMAPGLGQMAQMASSAGIRANVPAFGIKDLHFGGRRKVRGGSAMNFGASELGDYGLDDVDSGYAMSGGDDPENAPDDEDMSDNGGARQNIFEQADENRAAEARAAEARATQQSEFNQPSELDKNMYADRREYGYQDRPDEGAGSGSGGYNPNASESKVPKLPTGGRKTAKPRKPSKKKSVSGGRKKSRSRSRGKRAKSKTKCKK